MSTRVSYACLRKCFSHFFFLAVTPCFHMCLCKECSQTLMKTQPPECPLCRAHATGIVKIFFWNQSRSYSVLQRVAVRCSHILSRESTDSKPDYPVCTHPATHCNTLQLIAPPPFSFPSSLPPPPPPSLSSTPLSFFCVFTGYNLRFTFLHSNLIGQFASCDKMDKSRVQHFCGQSYQKSQVDLE